MHSPSQRPHIDFHDSVMAAHASLDLPAHITALLLSALPLFMSWRELIRQLTAGRIYCANTLLICIFRIIHYPETLRSCDMYLHKESGPGKRSPCPGCVGVPVCCLL